VNKFVRSVAQAKEKIAGAALAFGTSLAMATPSTTFDASAYETAIMDTIAGRLVVGGAVVLVVLAIKSTKWARRAL